MRRTLVRCRAVKSAPAVDCAKTKVNDFGIQVLPERVRSRLFSTPESVLPGESATQARKGLAKFGIKPSKSQERVGGPFAAAAADDVLPPLRGPVEWHFLRIAEEQVGFTQLGYKDRTATHWH